MNSFYNLEKRRLKIAWLKSYYTFNLYKKEENRENFCLRLARNYGYLMVVFFLKRPLTKPDESVILGEH